MNQTDTAFLARSLQRKAEEEFGITRAEELRPEIAQLAAEIQVLYDAPVDYENEP